MLKQVALQAIEYSKDLQNILVNCCIVLYKTKRALKNGKPNGSSILGPDLTSRVKVPSIDKHRSIFSFLSAAHKI